MQYYGAAGALIQSKVVKRMNGDAPFYFRMEHVGDAVFVDSNGKVSYDVSSFQDIFTSANWMISPWVTRNNKDKIMDEPLIHYYNTISVILFFIISY